MDDKTDTSCRDSREGNQVERVDDDVIKEQQFQRELDALERSLRASLEPS